MSFRHLKKSEQAVLLIWVGLLTFLAAGAGWALNHGIYPWALVLLSSAIGGGLMRFLLGDRD